jgi:hypothetical protein
LGVAVAVAAIALCAAEPALRDRLADLWTTGLTGPPPQEVIVNMTPSRAAKRDNGVFPMSAGLEQDEFANEQLLY